MASANLPGNRALTPLCVDLDGTLVRTDCLWECFAALIRKRPLFLLRVPFLLLKGRAKLKEELAAKARLDVALLPYNQEFIGFLEEERAKGRTLILATAASSSIARAVAAHLGIFDDVVASEQSNLKGSHKAEALAARFGKGQFSYAGNSTPDLKLWNVAASAVVVDTPGSVAKQIPASVPIERTFVSPSRLIPSLIRALRPYQWVKNVLVFVPILTSGAAGNIDSWIKAAWVGVTFSIVASALYVFNDISDLAADREHPRKRTRPFASGEISIMTGLAMSGSLLVVGFTISIMIGGWTYLLAYAVLSLGYTLRLKHMPLVDTFALAALYSLRLFAGGELTHHPVSMWLLGYSSFLFLSLALLKRVAELSDSKKLTRGYHPVDRAMLQSFGVASTFVSATVLALYVQSEMGSLNYQNPQVLWAIVPLLLLWQCRLWLATGRGRMDDDPIVFAAKDWVSRLIVLTLGVILFAGSFGW